MVKRGFGIGWFFLLLLLIFLASQADKSVMVAEARPRVCQSQSHGFRGSCVSDRNCGLVCRNERFTGGKCRGFRRRCYCTKPC